MGIVVCYGRPFILVRLDYDGLVLQDLELVNEIPKHGRLVIRLAAVLVDYHGQSVMSVIILIQDNRKSGKHLQGERAYGLIRGFYPNSSG